MQQALQENHRVPHLPGINLLAFQTLSISLPKDIEEAGTSTRRWIYPIEIQMCLESMSLLTIIFRNPALSKAVVHTRFCSMSSVC